MRRNNTTAPDFYLPDDEGNSRSISELREGKPLLLFFFRHSQCPTSRRDLMLYADVYSRIKAVDSRMAAISVESPETLAKLRQELGLPFPLLSDDDFSVSEQYGVYRSDESGEPGSPALHGEPAVFIIQSDGTLGYSQIQTGPKGSASPAEMTLMLLYMSRNDGKYW